MSSPAAFVEEITKLCTPKEVVWYSLTFPQTHPYRCTGSKEEYKGLSAKLVESKTFTPLNERLWPNSFLCRTSPDDVSRKEDSVFICSSSKEAVGPTGNWAEPVEMKKKVDSVFAGSMKGRFVAPWPL